MRFATTASGPRAYVHAWSFPTLVDSDGDGYNDFIDPRPLQFNINDLFAYNVGKLEQLANEFTGGSTWWDNRWNEFNVRREVWLVFMFIRQFNEVYTISAWDITGGYIDTDFVDFVRMQNRDLYDYFAVTSHIRADIDGGYVDLWHMAATLTAHLYRTRFRNHSNIQAFMPEWIIDDLAGWAGDLQSLIAQIIIETNGTNDYDVLRQAFNRLMGGSEDPYAYDYSRFSMEDLFANIDAVNLFNLFNSGPIEQTILEYYYSGYLQRYAAFLRNRGWLFRNTVTVRAWTDVAPYTGLRFSGVIVWPIFAWDDITSIPNNLSHIARNGFVEFLIEKLEAELYANALRSS